MGERYREAGITAVYAPDLQRAGRTAAIAFEGSGIPIRLDARLREIDYGESTGAARSEIDERRPSRVTAPFPGGESYERAVQRHRSAFDDIARAHGGETVLVIGCYATWMALEHLAAGRPLDEVARAEREWRPGWRYVCG